MIDLEFLGGKEVVARFDRLPGRLHDELKAGIGRLTLRLARIVQNEKLRGQVLRYRTGRLFRSINGVTQDAGNVISGIVSTALRYGKAHEEGFHGTVSVREHLREIKQAFGRSIAPKQVLVRAHDMKMNLPERSFLRSSLREMQESGAIASEINASIGRANA